MRSLALVALVGCGTVDSTTEVQQEIAIPISQMNIVAHQDDDLLFMNPDVDNLIGAGIPTTTVYLTAGEASGARFGTRSQTREVFAGAREEGARAAYARMAGVPNAWTHRAVVVANKLVQIDTLTEAPQVHLVFLRLPDGGDASFSSAYPLVNLELDRSGTAFTTTTIVPAPYAEGDVVVPSSYRYTRDDLVAVLDGLLDRYQPSIVRSLDPSSYARCYRSNVAPFPVPPNCAGGEQDPARHPIGKKPDRLHVTIDNTDHPPVAGFVESALEAYHGPFRTGRYQYLSYKTYSLGDHQRDLGTEEFERKYDVFTNYYLKHDLNAQHSWAIESALGPPYTDYHGYLGATYERFPASTTWSALVGSRLIAVGVEDRQLVWWSEDAPGGTWTGPTSLGGGPLAPHVTLVSTATSTYVFALQRPVASDTDPETRPAIVYNVLDRATRTWSGWQSMGNPDDHADGCYEPELGYPVATCDWLGEPVAAVDGSGMIAVFARNGYGKVSYRTLTGGVLGAWEPLTDPGQPYHTFDAVPYDALDGLAAITAADGTIHVFASVLDGWMVHWFQPEAGATFDADPSFPQGDPIAGASSAPTVARTEGDRLAVFFHAQASEHVMTAFEAPGGGWSRRVADLGAASSGGFGPVAAVRRSTGQIMLFARNGDDGISATWQTSKSSSFGRWTDLEGMIPMYPSAVGDADGRVVLLGIGFEGKLYVRRETAGIGSFSGWAAVGN